MRQHQEHERESDDQRERTIPLSELKPKQKGILRFIKAPQALAHRLMALGIVPGTEIEVVRTAAFGDPMEIQVRGFRLALRKRDAQFLLVELN